MSSKTTFGGWKRVALAASAGLAVVAGAWYGIGRVATPREVIDPAPESAAVAAVDEAMADSGGEALKVSLSGGTNVAATNQLEVKQTFSLRAGWNAIYLEVEPRNTSPLIEIDRDDDGNPIMEPALSTVESVFNPISPSLVSVWEWRTPVSTKDFLADPSEGLWDEPGWRRYYPRPSVGPDGEPREFLNDLYNLHGGRAYLVEMTTTLGTPAMLDVTGDPAVKRPRREVGAYNLGGFPIEPSVSPDVGGYVTPLPLDEVFQIQADGTWQKLWDRTNGNAFPSAELKYGEGYLLRAQEPGGSGMPDLFTKNALLDIETSDNRLDFSDRFVALMSHQRVTVRNRGASTASVNLTRIASASPVKVEVEEPAGTWVALGTTPVAVSLSAGEVRDLKFRVDTDGQTGDGASLIQIASTALGTRWFVPASAESASRVGLWVGDVYVTEVSEGRAGSTNIDDGMLAVGLSPLNDSGLRGSVQMTELTATMATSMELSLLLPDAEIVRPTGLDEPVEAWVGGWFFEDRNANGNYDADEPGFEGITVTLTGPATLETVTRSDGSWAVDNGGAGLADGDYAISYSVPATTTFLSYTQDFTVAEPELEEAGESIPTPVPGATPTPTTGPVTRPNQWPVEVSLSGGKVDEWKVQRSTGAPITLTPVTNVENDPEKPSLDFGWVTEYDAFLYSGTCSSINTAVAAVPIGRVKNGSLEAAVPNTVLKQPLAAGPRWLLDSVNPWLIRLEQVPPTPAPTGFTALPVACSEIRVGKPAGGAFTYRVLLRVTEKTDGTNTFLQSELLPYYETAQGARVSSVNSSIVKPVIRTGTADFKANETVVFRVTVDARDPRNPFKHKYHPDFDNLDAKFNPIDLNAVPPYQWEVPEVRRILKFTPTSDVPSGLNYDAEDVGWGGTVWGGNYEEIIKGVHQNEITVRGVFAVRRQRNGAELAAETQDYD